MIAPSPQLDHAFAALRPEAVVESAIDIQQIAAPTFFEQARARFVEMQFARLGLQHVHTDVVGNVLACRPGQGKAKPVLVTAHTDTVFPAETNLSVERTAERITAPGIGDNSMGVAGLLALADTLNRAQIGTAGDLWLAANVCEEGLGDLRGMRAVVNRFGESAGAIIVLEGMALGHLYHQAIGVHRLRITAHAEGGHSWFNYGNASAVHRLVSLAAQLVALPMPSTAKTTLNIGQISGGTSVNTIARTAVLELDLRSEVPATLAQLIATVEQLIADHKSHDSPLTVEVTSQRPAGSIPREHPLVQLAASALNTVGLRPIFNTGSTDANIPLSMGLPAVCLGLCRGGNAHRPDEYIEPATLDAGLKQLLMVALGAFDLN